MRPRASTSAALVVWPCVLGLALLLPRPVSGLGPKIPLRRPRGVSRSRVSTTFAPLTDVEAPAQPEPAQAAPSAMKKLLGLSLPTLGCTLMDPALRLMDTACVGQAAGAAAGQAALVPCSNILTFAFAAFFAMGQSLTNFFATHPFDPKGPNEGLAAHHRDLCVGALTNALVFVVLAGGASAAVMVFQATPLLTAVGASPTLLPLARNYLQICAPALPFAMLSAVIQGAFLGQQNALLPLKVVLFIAGPVNFVGDIFLTLVRGYGVAGVAIATSAAQFLAFVGFWAALRSQSWWRARRLGRLLPAWRNAMQSAVTKPLFKVAGVLMFRSLAAIASYSLMSLFATRLPTLELAAHQCAFQLWWLLSFAVEPFSTATQSIVAKEFKADPAGCKRFVRAAFTLAGVVSLALGGLQAFFLQSPFNAVLNCDPAVQSILSGHLCVAAALSHIPTAFAVVLDGTAIATGEASRLPIIFAASLAVCFATLATGAAYGLGLNGVWLGLHAFMLTRLLGHVVCSRTVWKLLFGKAEDPTTPTATPAALVA